MRRTHSRMGKAVWLVLSGAEGVVALTTAGSLCWGEPEVTETDGRVVVRNDHYVVTLSSQAGGLIEAIAAADGEMLTYGHDLYTDRGLWRESVYLGSHNESQATMQTVHDGPYLIARSSGELRPGPEQGEAAFPQITYTVQHVFDATPTVRVSWAATAQLDEACSQGFLAYVLAIVPHREWYASTVDGRLYRTAAAADGRTFQAASEPLSVRQPWLGVVLDTGVLLHFSELRSNVPLANVFFHESSDRSAALFFARLDGSSAVPVESGARWEAGFAVTIVPSVEEWSP